MSRFYGTLKSERKTISSKGGVREMNAHVRTWGHGIEVYYYIGDSGQTYCVVYETGGSEAPGKRKLLKEYRIKSEDAPNKRPGRDYYGSPVGGS
jgi:hypothetical protein